MLSLPQVHGCDVPIGYCAEHIQRERSPLEARLAIEDGRLRLQPSRVGISARARQRITANPAVVFNTTVADVIGNCSGTPRDETIDLHLATEPKHFNVRFIPAHMLVRDSNSPAITLAPSAPAHARRRGSLVCFAATSGRVDSDNSACSSREQRLHGSDRQCSLTSGSDWRRNGVATVPMSHPQGFRLCYADERGGYRGQERPHDGPAGFNRTCPGRCRNARRRKDCMRRD